MKDTQTTTSRVLIVDDDPIVRTSVRAVLEAAGLCVDEACDGFEAIAKFEACSHDVILLDMVMEGLDGAATCRALRDLRGGEVPSILVMTGEGDVAAIDRAFGAGATDFANKPLQYTVLQKRVQYMLRSSQALRSLRQSEGRLRDAQRIARLGYWDFEFATDRARASDETRELLDIPDHIEFLLLEDLLAGHPSGNDSRAWRMQFTAMRTDETLTFQSTISAGSTERILRHEIAPMFDDKGHLNGIRGTVQDVTERSRAEARIRRLAYYDPVTGLPNRSSLLRSAGAFLRHARQDGHVGALLSLDLDGFKQVNDTFGHGMGDQLLCEVGLRLVSCLRENDWVARSDGHEDEAPPFNTVARFGGDEFIVLLPDLHQGSDAVQVAERLVEVVGRPYFLQGREVVVSASVGVAFFGPDDSDVEHVLMNADIAMYHAKESGRNRFQLFDETFSQKLHQRRLLEIDLRRAIERGDLEMYYQPQVEAGSLDVIGFEALVRWNHPELGFLPPSDFIPIAEDSGLIIPLGDWVFERSCRDAVALQNEFGRPLRVGINVSSRQLRDPKFMSRVADIMHRTGIDPQTVEVEITEGCLMAEGVEAQNVLAELKAMGVSVALDDFGTGYSSLSYLRRFTIDVIKIDRSFVRDALVHPDGAAIVEAILALSQRLRLRVVAEGVEQQEQLAFLTNLGCDEIQGYLLSKPIPYTQFADWLRKHTPLGLVAHLPKPRLLSYAPPSLSVARGA